MHSKSFVANKLNAAVVIEDPSYPDPPDDEKYLTILTCAGMETRLSNPVLAAGIAVNPNKAESITKAAAGGKIGRIENIDISYESKDGEAVKLSNPVTHYVAEFTKGGKTSEIVVTPDGARVKD